MTQTGHAASTKGKLEESLNKGFTITAEIPPPKSANAEKNLSVASEVRDLLTAVNVTDNQRGMMRMSALAFSHLLVQEGCEPLLQLCCRDRNRLALESDLIGAAALGIRNICVMTGDYTTLGDRPGAKPVYDLDSVQLLRLVSGLTGGVYGDGKNLKQGLPFFVGAVVNPFYDPIELELLKVGKKIAAGAGFFQTQPFFDIASLDGFLEKIKEFDTKFLIGVTPLKSAKMIRFLNEKVLTSPIPDEIERRINGAADPAKEGLKVASEFVNEIRGRVDGVHLMPIGQVDKLPELLVMIGDERG
ncbi:MAG: methylenetetrahydrofolate reductase [Nitrospinota bacterium]